MATVLTKGQKTEVTQSPLQWCLDLICVTGTQIFKGGMVEIVNATGLIQPAGTAGATTAKVIGRAIEDTKTAAGISGVAPAGSRIRVECGVNIWANDVTNPVVQATVGQKVYVFNDITVSIDNTKTVAGVCVGLNLPGYPTGVAVLQTIAPLNV